MAAFSGRQILQAFSAALTATSDALKDFSRNASLDVSVEAVPSGVSRELAAALESLIRDSEGAEGSIEWTPDADFVDESAPLAPVSVEFASADAAVLKKAALHLAAVEPSHDVRIVGTVRVVSARRKAGTESFDYKSRLGARLVLSVRLSEEDFHIAAEAIASEQLLMVSGRQEKEGRTHWLYDASSVQIVEPPEPGLGGRARSNPNVLGQERAF